MDERALKDLQDMSNEAKSELRKTSKIFEDSGLLENPGWKTFQSLLEEQIQIRLGLVQKPLNELPGSDTQGKMFSLECIKGALIGLRLARSLPQTIIETVQEIAREERPPTYAQPDAETPGEKAP